MPKAISFFWLSSAQLISSWEWETLGRCPLTGDGVGDVLVTFTGDNLGLGLDFYPVSVNIMVNIVNFQPGIVPVSVDLLLI